MTKKADDSLTRVEKHLIRQSSPWFPMIAGFCHLAKNLYNHANFIVRNRFIKDNYWLRYNESDNIIKKDLEYPDYKAMPTAQSAQQTLRLLDKNWKSFGNLMTMVTNTGDAPLLIRGGYPKSVNQFYNKELAYWKSVCMMTVGKFSSARINRITAERNRRIDDYMRKASRIIVDECIKRGVSAIVIGKNKEWKQESKLSKRVNQHFVQLPFARLIQMIQYKASEKGIAVVLTEESYTSGTSFLDGELPSKANYDKNRRIHRGLFKADDGRLINADVNGAFQILRKVFPNVSANGIEGVVLRPVAVVAA